MALKIHFKLSFLIHNKIKYHILKKHISGYINMGYEQWNKRRIRKREFMVPIQSQILTFSQEVNVSPFSKNHLNTSI